MPSLVLKKLHRVRSMSAFGDRRTAIFGSRANVCRRASTFSFAVQNRFLNADSIDVDDSIDRGAQKRSKISWRLPYVCRRKSTRRDFLDPNKCLLARLYFFRCRSNSDFLPPIRSMSVTRSIEVLRNDRKFRRVCYLFLEVLPLSSVFCNE